MRTVEAETDFLDQLYSTAVEPDLWADVLTQFASMMDATEAQLLTQDEVAARAKTKALYVGGDPSARPLYTGHFVKCNPLLKTSDRPLALRVLTDEHKLSRQEFLRTEFYNDFLRRFDKHSFLIVRLALDLPITTTVTLVRPSRREPFSRADIAAAERFHSHMIRAWRMATRISGMDERRSGGDALLECSIDGIFVLDAAGNVRHVNPAGEALVADGGVLTLRSGILRAVSADATRKLHGLIAAAASPLGERRGGSMLLERPAGRPLSITVAPIVNERISLFGLAPTVLVCVSDPDRETAEPEDRLCELFHLTAAEGRVAAQLLHGHDPRAAAERLGVSYYTVRAHLVRIFSKTNTSRQAELVQLMTRMIGSPSLTRTASTKDDWRVQWSCKFGADPALSCRPRRT